MATKRMKKEKILDELTEIETLAQNSPRREKISRAIDKAKQLIKEFNQQLEEFKDGA